MSAAENNRQNVLYLWNYVEWGGVQIYFLSLIREAIKHYNVTVAMPINSAERIKNDLDKLGVDILYLDESLPVAHIDHLITRQVFKLKRYANERSMTSKVKKLFRGKSPIIHADIAFWNSPRSMYSLIDLGTLFYTIHTPIIAPDQIRNSIWKRAAKKLSATGRFHLLASNREAAKSLDPYFPETTIPVTYAGFDPNEIERIKDSDIYSDSLKERLNIHSEKKLVVTIGQFIERKGCWTTLEALKMLKDRNDFQYLWIATTEPALSEIEKINSYGLRDNFRVLSANDIGGRAELLSLLNAADIFVLASHLEGLPIAIIEAMALSRAIIATNINAIPEAIIDDKTGRLIESKDPAALASAIREMLDDNELRGRLGESARLRAYDLFDEKITAASTLELYDKVNRV